MTLRVVGAGLGRTGTQSLKLALEQLLSAPCYHMSEVFGRPDDVLVWERAIAGEPVDWDALFADYRAAVDWPPCAFWSPIADANPDAIILLSTRDVDAWWESARNTIFAVAARGVPSDGQAPPIIEDQMHMIDGLFRLFADDVHDEATAKAAYLAHNDHVRATAPKDRLVEWHPGDGWEPLCDALGLKVPDEPFPHTNTTADFRQMASLDEPPPS
jgi:hypothetical protein